MHTLPAVIYTRAGAKLIGSDVLSICCSQNLVTTAHIPCISNGNENYFISGLSPSFALDLKNRITVFPSKYKKSLEASVTDIICTEWPDRDVQEVRCMEWIVEKTLWDIQILVPNCTAIEAAKNDLNKLPKQGEKQTYPEQTTLTQNAFGAIQTVHVLPMTKITVLLRLIHPCLLPTRVKHAIFLNHRLRHPNSTHEINQEKI